MAGQARVVDPGERLVDVSITSSAYIGGPVGDLRLVPDLDRMTVLHAMPGWAWAPVDRRTQDGEPYPECQRSFARAAVAQATGAGVDLKMALEVEWVVGRAEGDGTTPGCGGPA